MQQEQRRPLECVFCRSEQRFRVTRATGKTLASGGFGFIEVLNNSNSNHNSFLQQEPSQKTNGDSKAQGEPAASGAGSVTENDDADGGASSRQEEVQRHQRRSSSSDEPSTEHTKNSIIADDDDDDDDKTSPTKQKDEYKSEQPPNHYLFLEEVIYLHERGLLHAFLMEEQSEETNQQNNQTPEIQQQQQQQPLQLSDLYKLLPVCNLPMATYLVYQHVRAQTFRVVRHSPNRRAILEAMRERIQSGPPPPPPSRQRQPERDRQPQPPQSSEDKEVLADDENCDGGDQDHGKDTGGVKSEAAVAAAPNAGDHNSPQQPNQKKQKTLNEDEKSNGFPQQNSNLTKELLADKDDDHPDSNENGNDGGGDCNAGHDDSISKAPTETGGTRSTSRKARHSWWKRDPEFRRLSLQLRAEAARAPPPQPNAATVALDCYHPNANFSSANPGVPDFYVAISFYSQSPGEEQHSFSFYDLQTILAQASSSNYGANGAAEAARTPSETRSVTVKVATVSDSGTVIMFGVSDYGVPIMEQPAAK